MKKINAKKAATFVLPAMNDSMAEAIVDAIFKLFLKYWGSVYHWCVIPGYFLPIRSSQGFPGVLFTVKGGWYCGSVAVIYLLGQFEIYLVDEEFNVSKTIGCAMPEEIVEAIDKEIGHIDRDAQLTEQEKTNKEIIRDTMIMYGYQC